MMRQAMTARRALLLIDGLDEGGQVRDQIERHIVEVLVPQGHVLLATSRPAGVSEQRFADFHRLRLSPLSDEQQLQAMEGRLGKQQASVLLPYLQENMPADAVTKERITGNPLMLSMLISVFEIRRGIAMPSTVAELYDVATRAMIERAGSNGDMTQALSALFYEAHIKQQRVITDQHFDAARQRLGSGASVDLLRECALQDRTPLLSVLQAEPLQMQASHLSFQEYYVARALGEGVWTLPQGTKPWKFEAWWANTLRLGAEMGDAFGRGLMHAAGVSEDALDLKNELGGDRSTALRAVAIIMGSIRSVRSSIRSRCEPALACTRVAPYGFHSLHLLIVPLPPLFTARSE
jgi:hypothetical protein